MRPYTSQRPRKRALICLLPWQLMDHYTVLQYLLASQGGTSALWPYFLLFLGKHFRTRKKMSLEKTDTCWLFSKVWQSETWNLFSRHGRGHMKKTGLLNFSTTIMIGFLTIIILFVFLQCIFKIVFKRATEVWWLNDDSILEESRRLCSTFIP